MSEGVIRVAVFAGLFAVLLLAQTLWPRREGEGGTWWPNLSIFVLGAVVSRLLVAVGAVAASEWAGANGWGLFNVVDVPGWLAVAASVVLLDFAVWGQHVLTHKVPVLWRLHEVHHADERFDLSTGLRFHPAEIGLSLLYKSAVVVLLGAPVLAVVAFEILLNGGSMFEHANLRLPGRVDAVLRKVVVTPDMHRVHHSVRREEADSNYGFFLSVWDRLFRTYRDQPLDGHEDMALGVAGGPRDQRLRTLLARPLAPRARSTPAR